MPRDSVGLARLFSRGQRGMDAYEVVIETHLAGGLPTFRISGLPAAAVRESKDRVRAALHTCGLAVPAQRITVHLGPADIPKEGGRYDLAIALGVTVASQNLAWATDGIEFLGELALNGELRPIRSALPAVLAARDAGRSIVLPAANAAEAALVEDATCYPPSSLLEVFEHLSGAVLLTPVTAQGAAPPPVSPLDLADVAGQSVAKRAPHHSASVAALVGGGGHPRPGEISLAHLGVLFLDELPEFHRAALESLREPLQSGSISIARAAERVTYPARFQLVAAMNPCPCGYLGDGSDRCRCSATRLAQYRARLSGPLLDRFDMHVEVPRVSFEESRRLNPVGETAAVAARVASGRAAQRWMLSARSCDRVLKVSRTIADLAGESVVGAAHVAEAIQLRCLDRQL